jgi:PAS domain S-box-containing protein
MVIKGFNREFEKLSGYASFEVIDKKIEMIFPKDKVASTLKLIKNTLNTKNVKIIEIDILTIERFKTGVLGI